jgi:hypothetical protein
MIEEEFLKQIKGIDINLWKLQVATVIDMQGDWMGGILRKDKERAEEVDGLVEVLIIITDFIEPIKTEEDELH